jgi:hypothetical protein
MENGPFMDGLPIKNGDFPYSYVKESEAKPSKIRLTFFVGVF